MVLELADLGFSRYESNRVRYSFDDYNRKDIARMQGPSDTKR